MFHPLSAENTRSHPEVDWETYRILLDELHQENPQKNTGFCCMLTYLTSYFNKIFAEVGGTCVTTVTYASQIVTLSIEGVKECRNTVIVVGTLVCGLFPVLILDPERDDCL